jgi:DNA-binding protein HU-beta
MSKAELIAAVAAGANISKTVAASAIESFTGTITKTLKKGGEVTLAGFGTFSVSKRSARTGRNPRTGEPIKIPASKTPKFSAGKALKEAIN